MNGKRLKINENSGNFILLLYAPSPPRWYLGGTLTLLPQTGQAIGRIENNSVTGMVRTQLIAHDKEVFDIAFSRAGGGRWVLLKSDFT